MTRAGAPTPEDLDRLIEDAFVLRDSEAFDGLFAEGAVLAHAGGPDTRGHEAIARALAAHWTRDRTYVADAHRVVQAGDTALVVARAGLHVLRRDGAGMWRAAILLLDTTHRHDRRTP